MVLSTFSHYSAFHIFANMYVLHSFSHGAVNTLGREQFLGLYLTGGVVSSFASYVCKTVTRQPGLSLGAVSILNMNAELGKLMSFISFLQSGAIMAILAYICSKYPDTQLSLLFLPMYTFSAGTVGCALTGSAFYG